LLADAGSGLFDDAGYLVLEGVFRGDVFLSVDAELISATSPFSKDGLSVLFALD
jgi:hypothetical protein